MVRHGHVVDGGPGRCPTATAKVHCVGATDFEHTGSNAKSLVSGLTQRRSIGKRGELSRQFLAPDLHVSAGVGVQVGVEGGTRNKTPRVLTEQALWILARLTSDYVEKWPYRRRGEKAPKKTFKPLRDLVGGDPEPISGPEGPNLPTDSKHAPRAQTYRRSWTPIACLSTIAIFVGPTIRAGLLGGAGPRFNRVPRRGDTQPHQSHAPIRLASPTSNDPSATYDRP
jgi:hypothetical protein